jgi:hypothetical protein
MVAGNVIYQNGEYTNVDRKAVWQEISAAATELQDAAASDPVIDDLAIVQLTREGKI